MAPKGKFSNTIYTRMSRNLVVQKSVLREVIEKLNQVRMGQVSTRDTVITISSKLMM